MYIFNIKVICPYCNAIETIEYKMESKTKEDFYYNLGDDCSLPYSQIEFDYQCKECNQPYTISLLFEDNLFCEISIFDPIFNRNIIYRNEYDYKLNNESIDTEKLKLKIYQLEKLAIQKEQLYNKTKIEIDLNNKRIKLLKQKLQNLESNKLSNKFKIT